MSGQVKILVGKMECHIVVTSEGADVDSQPALLSSDDSKNCVTINGEWSQRSVNLVVI